MDRRLTTAERAGGPSPAARLAVAVSVLVPVTALGAALTSLPAASEGLRDPVQAHLAESGVANPVTAVLMNFRGYDTMLEIVALVLAALGVRVAQLATPATVGAEPSPVLRSFLHLTMPFLVLVAAYLLWAGSSTGGGAFPAGAMLGAAGVLLIVGEVRWFRRLPDRVERALIAAGAIVFLAVGVAVFLSGRRLLEMPPPHAGALILLIEAVSTVSIGLILAALFAGGSIARGGLREDAA